LLRSDFSPWLVSITHEEYAYLNLSKEEYAQLVREVPQVNNMLVKEYVQ